jgi:glycosyltransferase involved in cell wall biosynthesis
VAVVNDTTDLTTNTLETCCKEFKLELKIIIVDFQTNPELYIPDSGETYQLGRSLAGETYNGLFTNKPLLANWSAARNLGWKFFDSSSDPKVDWKLFLDADDEVEDPESIPSLCRLLDEQNVDLAASYYHQGRNDDGSCRLRTVRERLAKCTSGISWTGHIHETLQFPTKRALLDGSLRVWDRKDSRGADLRVPDRNFKVMYFHSRRRGWDIPARHFMLMASEIKDTWPAFALTLLERYLEKGTWREERAWALCLAGDIQTKAKNLRAAAFQYSSAADSYPSYNAAFRLGKTWFELGEWARALDAYETGVTFTTTPQMLDAGKTLIDASKIWASVACRKIGHYDKAVRLCNEALQAFPDNETLKGLYKDLEKQLRKSSR